MPMMSTWLLDVLGCSSYVSFLCLLVVDNQVIVIHLVPNKRKASKANQCFVFIIQMTEATNVYVVHVATDFNDDDYHLFTDILLVKTEAAYLGCEDLR